MTDDHAVRLARCPAKFNFMPKQKTMEQISRDALALAVEQLHVGVINSEDCECCVVLDECQPEWYYGKPGSKEPKKICEKILIAYFMRQANRRKK